MVTQWHHCGWSVHQLFKTRVAESQLCRASRGEVRGDVGLNSILTVCCSHCHCSRQSVMAIGQSWLADDDGYDTSTPYYHSSVYGWYNGFVWWVRFLSTLHLLHREEELRSMGKVFFRPSTASVSLLPLGSQALTIERTPDQLCFHYCPGTLPFMLKPPQVIEVAAL